MPESKPILEIRSISELHRLMGLPKPLHPLISLVDLGHVKSSAETTDTRTVVNFYTILFKKDVVNKLKYGQQYYDFDTGMVALFAPHQVMQAEISQEPLAKGWGLIFHPDFIRHYSLGQKITEYGFFSYSVHEALHLSEKEEALLLGVLQNIRQEYESSIDKFSQDVMVSHLEVLLNYINRFYNRQFLTRKHVSSDVLSRLDSILSDYMTSVRPSEQGLPTVGYVAEQLHFSPNYLSDLLKEETGKTAQQHIHDKLIELAKDYLATLPLSVGEIAFKLGFQHTQSFNKLFKAKTGQTPNEYRQLLN